ncbi:protein phosphatase 2C domain-containing protein [Ensifer sp. ENS05]|uniref:PP2C family serine/threonine-protein phosphatase n=1 Tax=Ensifer sp. ENS05 TaxID=2769277 RepID=UPI00178172A5|nr:PP2C family serine/threonine-protein phosphatase [Ensifer sp. ENS05]MBD9597666.1 protein phosphatase 2C domain-containing protein [Ensifer sp. ENS05]
MTNSWRWAGARSIGTSHVKSGTACQDFICAKLFIRPEGQIMAAVVSDGAGSASHAEIGSKLVCLSFLRACREFLIAKPLDELVEEDVWEWLDEVREAINAKANSLALRPRDFASTLVAVLAGPATSIMVHIGDGAVVWRKPGTEEWEVPSWPYHGEYASTTVFVTDDPQPKLSYFRMDESIQEFALFSDGIERLVLEQATRSAHAPFFNRMLAPLRSSDVVGPDKHLSTALRDYLDSPGVCERTDDDKSLILGVRT